MMSRDSGLDGEAAQSLMRVLGSGASKKRASSTGEEAEVHNTDMDPDLSGTGAFDASDGQVPLPSWDELVREHADRVYRLAYRLSGNAHDAEDLTQETFIRVFRSLSSYQPGTFEGWLHRITTNLFLDMVRRRSRIRMEALPEDYERVPSGGPDPEQIYHDSRLDPHLQRALDGLAPDYRAAVVLCDIEGLSYEEIAATLGVKLGTVRSRIHRGRQALRENLRQMGVLGTQGLAPTSV
ncbi:RNA polymerase sigma factor SigE [Hoyosella altamirensis]